jgi:hypothetical protein
MTADLAHVQVSFNLDIFFWAQGNPLDLRECEEGKTPVGATKAPVI